MRASASRRRRAPTKCSPAEPAPSTTTRRPVLLMPRLLSREDGPAVGRGAPGMTERAGFEPATHLSARTRFPVALLRPLGHLSGRRQRIGARKPRPGQPAADETYAATSWICSSLSEPEKEGITPWPFVTRSTTSSYGGCAAS